MTPTLPSRLRRAARTLVSRSAREDALHEWRLRLQGEPALPAGRIERVLVVCHGNLCRSPFAAALLAAQGLPLEVRSGGLAAGQGEPADPGALRAAQRAGISLAAHRTHRVSAEDLRSADLVLAMEGHQLAAVARALPEAAPRSLLLGGFLREPPHSIPDPWGKPDDVFDAVFARIAQAVEQLAARLRGARP